MLILVRHAHAEWPHYKGPDFDRPLTEQGFADARVTGRAIVDAGHQPVLLLASSALRTRQTADIIAEELQLPESAVQYLDSLYNANAFTLEVEARRLAPAVGSALMVAHNPGVSTLAQRLARDDAAPPYKPAEWRVFTLPQGRHG
jgi:phosphohistidine phosphatase